MAWISYKNDGGKILKDIFRFIKRLFGKYEIGYKYWIYIKDIKVPQRYKKTKIGTAKWNHKMGYWLRTGEFDGYSTYKICKTKNIDKVPVYFVD